ncbi:DJ-1 family glyoxalase III [Leadbettera azotonutricia]|uniref:Protein ThiJ n=1 Tax=Leadbettera azotonutricia (strain ATCC BAA-888 / DSM 13862 / ZAS-9) TaxID=545695 RepID=F5Y9X1_LEAAZ|nr:DJ-1 family glyoxalase III [Leadbettera azotonutricia]AEF83057.1 protein ThiJ [Leadbettera azotonutricia ZAS-9]
MTKKALVLLAEGFEEVEAITPIDYLRRAGVEVTIAAIGKSKTVKGSRGMELNSDAFLADLLRKGTASSFDALVLPGGSLGAENLAASKEAGDLLKEEAAKGKLICAICASPVVVLAPLGMLKGKKFTCNPGVEKEVQDAVLSHDRVVTDGNIITSRAAGTAGNFAAAIIAELVNRAEAEKLAKSVMLI